MRLHQSRQDILGGRQRDHSCDLRKIGVRRRRGSAAVAGGRSAPGLRRRATDDRHDSGRAGPFGTPPRASTTGRNRRRSACRADRRWFRSRPATSARGRSRLHEPRAANRCPAGGPFRNPRQNRSGSLRPSFRSLLNSAGGRRPDRAPTSGPGAGGGLRDRRSGSRFQPRRRTRSETPSRQHRAAPGRRCPRPTAACAATAMPPGPSARSLLACVRSSWRGAVLPPA